MASDKNSITIDGNITKDPVLKYTATGTAICTFSIASNRFYKKGNGFERETSFFDVQCWSQLAQDMSTKTKGQAVSIQGRIKQESWIDKNTGLKRSNIIIVANDIEFVIRNNGNRNYGNGNNNGDCPF